MSRLLLTREAYLCLEEAGADVRDSVERDRRALRDGKQTEAGLLAHCLDGAEPDRVQGWTEYVATIVLAADRNQEIDLSEVAS